MKPLHQVLVLATAASVAVFTSFNSETPTKSVEYSPNETAVSVSKPHLPTTTKSLAVIELFTSEGCSSCPAADEVLSSFMDNPNVVALGFHVTYWNRLGWKDPFSQPIFDKRQYEYGDKFKANGVYTPQAVINGASELVGSKKSQVEKLVKTAIETPSEVSIELEKIIKPDGEIQVKYKLTGDVKNAVLNLAFVENDISTKVLRGENGGKTLHHDNIVRDFQTVEVKNTEGAFSFFTLKDWQVKNAAVVAYVQDRETWHVRGAAKTTLR